MGRILIQMTLIVTDRGFFYRWISCNCKHITHMYIKMPEGKELAGLMQKHYK